MKHVYTKTIIALALCLLSVSHLQAQSNAWVLATFHDTPEGLAIDEQGNIYTSLVHTGEIIKVTPEGKQQLIAVVPSVQDAGKGDVLGIDFDNKGNLYVAYNQHSEKYGADDIFDPFHPACRDATVTMSGVYKIDVSTGEVSPLATKADGWAFCFPDDVEIDSQGNVFMTDLTYSGIWKISADGKNVTLWSSDPLLNWSNTPYSGIPMGVNVLELDKTEKYMFAATDGEPMVVKIPINKDGSAGKAIIVDRGYTVLDGLTFDDDGTIYISEIMRNEIWAIAPDGSRTQVANGKTAPLDNNSSLIWHNGTLCTANLGAMHASYKEADRTIVCIRDYEKP